jgi:hypothetical protein
MPKPRPKHSRARYSKGRDSISELSANVLIPADIMINPDLARCTWALSGKVRNNQNDNSNAKSVALNQRLFKRVLSPIVSENTSAPKGSKTASCIQALMEARERKKKKERVPSSLQAVFIAIKEIWSTLLFLL